MQGLLNPSDPLSTDFLTAVGQTLDSFLEAQTALLTEIGSSAMLPVAREAVSGGKRLRPAYCYWAYAAAAGQPANPQDLLKVASSLDLLHVSALVHDDLIDDANTRRGLPAAHKRFEELHQRQTGHGDRAEFGRSAAILLGDLLLMWSIELADESRLDLLDAARGSLSAMRAEVTAGQFLDVAAQYRVAGANSVADELAVAQKVLEFKSARYSIRRPAQIGAILGGASAQLQSALGEFGSMVGRAFQLRDDVLGSFGDPAITGKPYGGDVKEGKRTVLVLKALSVASPEMARELDALLGAEGLTDSDVQRAVSLIEQTGARQEVEQIIDQSLQQALAILESTPMHDEGRTALAELALRSVHRAH